MKVPQEKCNFVAEINIKPFDMKRFAIKELQEWKNSSERKPLILRGARQVGKTFLLKEFGEKYYDKMAYVNCDNNPRLSELFAAGYDITTIIRNLSAITRVNITAGDTLIVFDEVQEIPNALTSLKYFCEDAPEYHVAVAGSLLGIALHEGTSAPVGKVDIMELFPMTFGEFLCAKGDDAIWEMIESCDWTSMKIQHSYIVDCLRQYYFTGGMPAAVRSYVESGNLEKVRKIQKGILKTFQDDMSKHAPSRETPRINMVWESISSQLSRDNKKFIYGAVKPSGRASEFEVAIQWLKDCGLVYQVRRAKEPHIPLKFYEDLSAFKLFMLDCGLMGAQANVAAKRILIGDDIFKEYKGAFTEQYVLQQFVAMDDMHPYYYSNDNSTMEIDFIVQHADHVIPIEVKAEENLRSKSLRSYINRHPELHGIRFSMSNYREQEWMTNIPLYAVTAIM